MGPQASYTWPPSHCRVRWRGERLGSPKVQGHQDAKGQVSQPEVTRLKVTGGKEETPAEPFPRLFATCKFCRAAHLACLAERGGMGHRRSRAGDTHGRVPGCASASGAHAGNIRLRKWQWRSRYTRSRPMSHSCGRLQSAPIALLHHHTSLHPVPRPAPLPRRRRTRTTRSAAAGAPRRGTGQGAAAAAPRSGCEARRPGGRSPVGT